MLSTLESADGQKSPISRMRESLDKVGKSRENFVEESEANDGSRYAQINVAGSIFCVEERRGLINFSGINEKAYRHPTHREKMSPRPILNSSLEDSPRNINLAMHLGVIFGSRAKALLVRN